MLFRILFLGITFIFFQSCNDDDGIIKVINDRTAINCVEGVSINSFTYQSSCPNVIDSTKFCEKIFIETPIYLEEENEYWISQFCLNIGDELSYVNENQETSIMTVIDKDLNYSTTNVDVENECLDDKKKKYVVQFESANISVGFSHLAGELKIKLSQRFEIENGEVKNAPNILMNYNLNNLTYVPMDLNFDMGNFQNLDTVGIEYIERLEIFNEEFLDVYTDHKNNNGDIIQVFYNQSYGIVSFIDKNNVQWKLNTL